MLELTSTIFSTGNPKAYSPINKNCVFSASSMDNPDSEMVFYLMLRAVDRFYQQHSRYPGMTAVYSDFSLKTSQNQIIFLCFASCRFFYKGELFGYCQTITICAVYREGK